MNCSLQNLTNSAFLCASLNSFKTIVFVQTLSAQFTELQHKRAIHASDDISLLQCSRLTQTIHTFHAAMASQSGDTMQAPTAGIIVIGDEILKGRIQDTNSHFISRRLHNIGINVKKICVIGDDLATIAKEVLQFSETYTHVITTGGIGPTHDDVTYQGIAAAFNDQLVAHPSLVAFIGDYFKTDDLSSPSMKMAHIPSTASLVYGEDRTTGYKSRFPLVSVRNVMVLPGVPGLLEKAFKLIDKQVYGDHRHVSCVDLFLSLDEVSIATALNSTVSAHPHVTIGSYPQLLHSYYKTHLTMEAAELSQAEEAKLHFVKQIDPAYVLDDYVSDSLTDAWPRLQVLMINSPQLKESVEKAVQLLEDCLRQYKPEEICVCFNGGKDCLVVLHLFYALLHKRQLELATSTGRNVVMNGAVDNNNTSSSSSTIDVSGPTSEQTPTRLQTVYITEDNTFPQITEFVNRTINRYDLDCTILPGPMKGALHSLLLQRPHIKAVIMGTRRTDPYSDTLSYFQATDKDWPVFMRVHPILDWQYDTVWSFIRGLYLSYCTLYDRGYTSLGNAGNTVQNSLLLTTDRLGQPTYRPAYLLKEHCKERNGRT